MEPLTPDQLRASIARVTVTNLVTAVVNELTTRPDSTCHFFDLFEAGEYLIQLRLDWSDIDANGHPRLDADFLDPVTRKHIRPQRAHSAHHTDSLGAGDRSYRWQFEDVELHLRVSVDWMLAGTITAKAKLSANLRVIRADGTEEQPG